MPVVVSHIVPGDPAGVLSKILIKAQHIRCNHYFPAGYGLRIVDYPLSILESAVLIVICIIVPMSALYATNELIKIHILIGMDLKRPHDSRKKANNCYGKRD